MFLTLFVTSLFSKDDLITNFNYFGNLSASKLNSAGYDLNSYPHDSVSDTSSLLNKPGRFNDEERAIMDQHVILGHDMLKHSYRHLLKAAAIVALEHHEKWDGTGYPNAKSAEDIHIFGRITALADVFDALESERVYKKAWDDERIFRLFKNERAKHFDPKLIDLFFENIDEFMKIRDKFKD